MGGLLFQVLQARALSEPDQDPTERHPDMTMKTRDIVTRLREQAQDRKETYRAYWLNQTFDYEIPYMENQAADEIERLRVLLKLFDNHYVCEDCAELSATYLENCQNPLHKLHEAAWEIES